MTIELGLILSLIAGAIGFASFFTGRRTAVKKDGEEWGEFKSDIKHIKTDVEIIKSDVKDTKAEYIKELADIRKEFKSSIRRVHNRMDIHEEKYHGKPITRKEGDEN